MTYCLGMLLKDGLVMISDTRTNAGVDNISSYKKLHILEDSEDRTIIACTAGNLSVTQTAFALLREGLEEDEDSEGRRFVLQGGDCAERFVDCAKEPIEAKLKILLQMSVVLTWGGHTPVVRVARMAGQFAKPRSRPTEVVEGYGEIASYRGDHVNGFHPSERTPDPHPLSTRTPRSDNSRTNSRAAPTFGSDSRTPRPSTRASLTSSPTCRSSM